mmetsp:Transcript_25100/g.37094  ORF Transcript_25100/g.37094 Transcript_25100/m.37094 type:complete len:160 (+) Transcript_25100:122-601(+)|eukprot:CAMPEP_0194213824 /NCGR_PEP_ID=MMETSP0156-20130528/14647_1 /TAXON_ID=33649 /ORGANISM="Thalassionema nitzschioides, Strain L26-B" /LENGTH=159 /DNA_ID=CAMNT_0038941943 /DNA_START=51 /DNA_END=530 /DNA_ORIENTATION=-
MAEDMNTKMARIVPELKSVYAKYPMKRNLWLDPRAQANTGEPAFIPHPNNSTTPIKPDYVWGPGTLGFGYYHLLTRDSYLGLFRRLQNDAPAQCCACSAEASKIYNDHTDVKMIVYNRSVASRPDDVLAKKEAMDIARGVSQGFYHMDQNFQLVVMAVT